ncbi:hypothetical protein JOC27_001039 [Sporolactobacillus spathodeae]|uniref:Uncharacterized protein n=2 Tax=Sporolactobacillus spathodeae TaxID=1465502 RepID=A0ABS2Q8F0_9BACL|nr:hypothetical protein [Sporolactobacillus spathodeae]
MSIEDCEPSYIFGNMAHLSLPGDLKLPDYEGKTGMLPEWTAARGKDRTACFLFLLEREAAALGFFISVTFVQKEGKRRERALALRSASHIFELILEGGFSK